MLIQLRTDTGLAAVLRTLNVPGFETGIYMCEIGRETVRHVLVYCSLENDRRDELRDSHGILDVETLLSSEKGAAKAAK